MAIKFLNTVQVDTDVLYVDASTNKVGIGTTSPNAKLDVYGGLHLGTTGVFSITQSPFTTTQFYITGGGNGGTITFGAPAANQQNVSVQGDLYSYQGSIGTKQFGSFNNKISYNGDNYLNSGNLGIGTTSPATKLHISDATTPEVRIQDTTNNRYLSLYQNDSNSYIQSSLNSALVLSTHGANERMRITTAGNVGIGTTSPDSKLNIEGTKNTAILTLGNTTQGSSWVVGDRVGGIDFYSADGSGGGIGVKASISYENAVGDTGSSQAMVFRTGGNTSGTNNVERMRLQYNGNVGIGTTSPGSKLQVDGEIDANGGDGYRINGKPWAAESSNNLRLGDWDGEGFTTTIYDDTSAPVVLVGGGKVGIGTTSPSEKLQVSGNVKANNYINQRVAWNSGFNHGSNNAASYYFIPVGYIAESTADTYYNNWIAPYAGRVRKIVMRNTGTSTVPTATTINFRITVNGTVVHTGSTITVTGSGLNILASETLSDSTAVFSATDRVQVAYRTNGLWRNAAAGISLEYTE